VTDNRRIGTVEGFFTAAQNNFHPVEKFLDHIARVIVAEYGCSLERRDVEQGAGNAFEVRYSLHDECAYRLSLTFLVVGENADELLFQSHERSGTRDLRSNPAEFDQHVYHLHTLDPLKTVIREKVIDYLATHYPERSPDKVEKFMH